MGRPPRRRQCRRLGRNAHPVSFRSLAASFLPPPPAPFFFAFGTLIAKTNRDTPSEFVLGSHPEGGASTTWVTPHCRSQEFVSLSKGTLQ